MLQDAKCYGACRFEFIVLQIIEPTSKMAPFEQFWMDYLRQCGVSCYNITAAYEMPRYIRHVSIPRASCFTRADVSSLVGISISAITKLVKAQAIPSFWTGREWRFTPEQVLQVAYYYQQYGLKVKVPMTSRHSLVTSEIIDIIRQNITILKRYR
jgi:hypothetical protein